MEDKLNELSLMNALIFGMLFAASYYVLFYHAANPEAVISDLDQNITSMRGEIAQLDRQIQEGEKLKSQIKEKEQNLAKFYKYIPEEISLEQGAGSVSEEARLAGLSIESIQTGANWKNLKTISVATVDVRVQGKFNQIMIFLSEMTRKDQVYYIKQIKISEAGFDKTDLSLEAKIEFYKRFEPEPESEQG